MTASYSPILRQCADIADERESQYGDVAKNFAEIVAICEAIFGLTLTQRQVAQVMIAVKLSRERHKHKPDNLIDAINYLAILASL